MNKSKSYIYALDTTRKVVFLLSLKIVERVNKLSKLHCYKLFHLKEHQIDSYPPHLF